MTVDPRTDQDERRRVAAEILGIADDLQRNAYALSTEQAIELAGRVWMGAALRQLQETIQDEAAILRARSVLLDG